MKATSYKRITLFLCIVLLLALAAIGAIFGVGSTQASAATYTTPKYKTYGQTTEGTTKTSGSPTNFTIYMHGSSTSGTGTMYNDKLIDWSYVYIKIEVSAMSAHESFKLTNAHLRPNFCSSISIIFSNRGGRSSKKPSSTLRGWGGSPERSPSFIL